MILTVTLNAALDVSYDVDAVRPGESHRVRSVHQRAGGKGINVARILHAMGHDVLVTGLAGGAAGAVVLGGPCGGGHPGVPGADRGRVSPDGLGHLARDRGGHAVQRAGARPSRTRSGRAWWTGSAGWLSGARVVVLSGSLPPGVPDDAYAQLVRIARAAGCGDHRGRRR